MHTDTVLYVLTPPSLPLCPSDRPEWWDSSILLQLPCSCMQGQDVCVFWSEWSQDHQQPLPVWVQGPHVSHTLCLTYLCHSSSNCQCYMGLIIIPSSQVDTHPDRTLTARLPSTSPETLRPHYGCLWPPPVCIWRCCWQHSAQWTALLRCGLSVLGGDPPKPGQWSMNLMDLRRSVSIDSGGGWVRSQMWFVDRLNYKTRTWSVLNYHPYCTIVFYVTAAI